MVLLIKQKYNAQRTMEDTMEAYLSHIEIAEFGYF